MEEIVIAHAGVEQVARFYARGIVVYVKRGTCNVQQLCARGRRIRAADGSRAYRKSLRQGSRVHDSTSIHAEKPDGSLLSCIKKTGRISEVVKVRIAGHQAAVVAPVHGYPRQGFPGLVLEMGCLIEGLVVVDAKYFSSRDAGAQPADLRWEIAPTDVTEHGNNRKAMKIGHAHTHGRPVNL